MKKIKIVLFLLPLTFYIYLFLLYEPYNYLGLHDNITAVERGSAITILRLIENNKTDNIILGASKLDEMDPDLLSDDLTLGEKWLNLHMPGASIKERNNILHYIGEKEPLNTVILETGFWSANSSPFFTRYDDQNVLDIAKDGFLNYFFSGITQKKVVDSILHESIKDRLIETKWNRTGKYDDNIDINYWKERYQSNITNIWEPQTTLFFPDTHIYTDILDIIHYCQDNNIFLRIYSSPIHNASFNYLKENQLAWEHDFYKEFISMYWTFYDMEFEESAWANTYGLFADGNHYNGETILGNENPLVTDVYRTMFWGKGQEMKVITKPEHIRQLFQDDDVLLQGNGDLNIYSQPMQLEENSVYVVRCSGNFPEESEVLYIDLFDLSGAIIGGLAGVPLRIGESDDYLLILSDMNRTEAPRPSNALFRIVYQGTEDIHLDTLEVLQYKNDDYKYDKNRDQILLQTDMTWGSIEEIVNNGDVIPAEFTAAENLHVFQVPYAVEAGAQYIVRVNGLLPESADVLYCDFYDPETGTISSDSLINTNENEYTSVLYGAPGFDTDGYFRVVYVGGEELHIDDLVIVKHK